jgi:predicted DNA-binding transcriptional regulator YafY
MYKREELVVMTNEQLVDIVLSLQEVAERGKNIAAYYARKSSNSKFSAITPEEIARLHEDGFSLTEIKHKLEKEGRVENISIQTLMYKLKKWEEETGRQIYRPGNKGRKKKNPTIFD